MSIANIFGSFLPSANGTSAQTNGTSAQTTIAASSLGTGLPAGYYTGGGGGGAGVINTAAWVNSVTSSHYGDIVLSRSGKPDLKVGDALDEIMARLAIIQPDFAKMEKYPALKEAYDAYKIIEAMCQEQT